MTVSPDSLDFLSYFVARHINQSITRTIIESKPFSQFLSLFDTLHSSKPAVFNQSEEDPLSKPVNDYLSQILAQSKALSKSLDSALKTPEKQDVRLQLVQLLYSNLVEQSINQSKASAEQSNSESNSHSILDFLIRCFDFATEQSNNQSINQDVVASIVRCTFSALQATHIAAVNQSVDRSKVEKNFSKDANMDTVDEPSPPIIESINQKLDALSTTLSNIVHRSIYHSTNQLSVRYIVGYQLLDRLIDGRAGWAEWLKNYKLVDQSVKQSIHLGRLSSRCPSATVSLTSQPDKESKLLKQVVKLQESITNVAQQSTAQSITSSRDRFLLRSYQPFGLPINPPTAQSIDETERDMLINHVMVPSTAQSNDMALLLQLAKDQSLARSVSDSQSVPEDSDSSNNFVVADNVPYLHSLDQLINRMMTPIIQTYADYVDKLSALRGLSQSSSQPIHVDRLLICRLIVATIQQSSDSPAVLDRSTISQVGSSLVKDLDHATHFSRSISESIDQSSDLGSSNKLLINQSVTLETIGDVKTLFFVCTTLALIGSDPKNPLNKPSPNPVASQSKTQSTKPSLDRTAIPPAPRHPLPQSAFISINRESSRNQPASSSADRSNDDSFDDSSDEDTSSSDDEDHAADSADELGQSINRSIERAMDGDSDYDALMRDDSDDDDSDEHRLINQHLDEILGLGDGSSSLDDEKEREEKTEHSDERSFGRSDSFLGDSTTVISINRSVNYALNQSVPTSPPIDPNDWVDLDDPEQHIRALRQSVLPSTNTSPTKPKPVDLSTQSTHQSASQLVRQSVLKTESNFGWLMLSLIDRCYAMISTHQPPDQSAQSSASSSLNQSMSDDKLASLAKTMHLQQMCEPFFVLSPSDNRSLSHSVYQWLLPMSPAYLQMVDPMDQIQSVIQLVTPAMCCAYTFAKHHPHAMFVIDQSTDLSHTTSSNQSSNASKAQSNIQLSQLFLPATTIKLAWQQVCCHILYHLINRPISQSTVQSLNPPSSKSGNASGRIAHAPKHPLSALHPWTKKMLTLAANFSTTASSSQSTDYQVHHVSSQSNIQSRNQIYDQFAYNELYKEMIDFFQFASTGLSTDQILVDFLSRAPFTYAQCVQLQSIIQPISQAAKKRPENYISYISDAVSQSSTQSVSLIECLIAVACHLHNQVRPFMSRSIMCLLSMTPSAQLAIQSSASDTQSAVQSSKASTKRSKKRSRSEGLNHISEALTQSDNEQSAKRARWLISLFCRLVDHDYLVDRLIERFLLNTDDVIVRDYTKQFLLTIWHSIIQSTKATASPSDTQSTDNKSTHQSVTQFLCIIKRWLARVANFGTRSVQLIDLVTKIAADTSLIASSPEADLLFKQSVNQLIIQMLDVLNAQYPVLLNHPLRQHFKNLLIYQSIGRSVDHVQTVEQSGNNLSDHALNQYKLAICNPSPCNICHSRPLERLLNLSFNQANKQSSEQSNQPLAPGERVCKNAQPVSSTTTQSILKSADVSISQPIKEPILLDSRVHRLGDVSVESKYGSVHQSVKLVGLFCLPALQLKVNQSGRQSLTQPIDEAISQSIKGISIWFSNYSNGHDDLESLGLPPSVNQSMGQSANQAINQAIDHKWIHAKTVTIDQSLAQLSSPPIATQSANRELKISFFPPVVASYILIHYYTNQSFHESLKHSSSPLLRPISHSPDQSADPSINCPRCKIPTYRGTCLQCNENAYACRQCRYINYQLMDSLICCECGACRHFAISWSAVGTDSLIDCSMDCLNDNAPGRSHGNGSASNRSVDFLVDGSFDRLVDCENAVDELHDVEQQMNDLICESINHIQSLDRLLRKCISPTVSQAILRAHQQSGTSSGMPLNRYSTGEAPVTAASVSRSTGDQSTVSTKITENDVDRYIRTSMSKFHSYQSVNQSIVNSTRCSIARYLKRLSSYESTDQSSSETVPASQCQSSTCFVCGWSLVQMIITSLTVVSTQAIKSAFQSVNQPVQQIVSQSDSQSSIPSVSQITSPTVDQILSYLDCFELMMLDDVVALDSKVSSSARRLLSTFVDLDTSDRFLGDRLIPRVLRLIYQSTDPKYQSNSTTVILPDTRSKLQSDDPSFEQVDHLSTYMSFLLDLPRIHQLSLRSVAQLLIASVDRSSNRNVAQSVLAPLLDFLNQRACSLDPSSQQATDVMNSRPSYKSFDQGIKSSVGVELCRHRACGSALTINTLMGMINQSVGQSITQSISYKSSTFNSLSIDRSVARPNNQSSSRSNHTSSILRTNYQMIDQPHGNKSTVSTSALQMSILCDALGLTHRSIDQSMQPSVLHILKSHSRDVSTQSSPESVNQSKDSVVQLAVWRAFNHWKAVTRRRSIEGSKQSVDQFSTSSLSIVRSLLLNGKSFDVQSLTLKLLLTVTTDSSVTTSTDQSVDRSFALVFQLVELLKSLQVHEYSQSLPLFVLMSELMNRFNDQPISQSPSPSQSSKSSDQSARPTVNDCMRLLAFLAGLTPDFLIQFIGRSISQLELTENEFIYPTSTHPAQLSLNQTVGKTTTEQATVIFGCSALLTDLMAASEIRQFINQSSKLCKTDPASNVDQSVTYVAQLISLRARMSCLMIARNQALDIANQLMDRLIEQSIKFDVSIDHSTDALVTQVDRSAKDRERKMAIRAYVCALNDQSIDASVTPRLINRSRFVMFVCNGMLEWIDPSINQSMNRSVVLRKSPSQEEYILGTISPAVYQTNQFADGLMSSIVDHICSMHRLTNEANLIEVLVADRLIDQSLPIDQVFDQVWKPYCLAKMSQMNNQSVSTGVQSLNRPFGQPVGRLGVSRPAAQLQYHSDDSMDDDDDMMDEPMDPAMQRTLSQSSTSGRRSSNQPVELPPMPITYRLTGLDGEATEQRIDHLDQPADQLLDPEVEYAPCQILSEPATQMSGGQSTDRRPITGLELIIHHLASISSLDREIDQSISQSIIKILGHACKVSMNREFLASINLSNDQSLGQVNNQSINLLGILAHQLSLSLASVDRLNVESIAALNDKSINRSVNQSVTQSAVDLCRALISLIQSINLSNNQSDNNPTSQSSTDEPVNQSELTELKSLLSFLSSSKIRAHHPPLNQSANHATNQSNQTLIDGLLSVLPVITRGKRQLVEVLAKSFIDHIIVRETNDLLDLSGDHRWWVESFALLTKSLTDSSISSSIRDYFFEQGVTSRLVDSLYDQSLSQSVDQLQSLPALPSVLTILTGLVYKQPKAQLHAAKLIDVLRALEPISSTTQIGSLSESLLNAITVNNDQLNTRLADLRDSARQEKRKLAMKQRAKMLAKMGFNQASVPSTDSTTTNKSATQSVNQSTVISETGSSSVNQSVDKPSFRCCICDGTSEQGLMGLYVFIKPVKQSVTQSPKLTAFNPFMNQSGSFASSSQSSINQSVDQSISPCMMTVTHFTLIHFKCHVDASVADRKLKPPKTEFEGASIRNAHTKCNALLPINQLVNQPVNQLTTQSINKMYHSEYLTQFELYCQSLPSSHYQSTNPSVTQSINRLTFFLTDLSSLLLRFASGLSFSLDALGGGQESNLPLILFLLQLALNPLVNQSINQSGHHLIGARPTVRTAFTTYTALKKALMKQEQSVNQSTNQSNNKKRRNNTSDTRARKKHRTTNKKSSTDYTSDSNDESDQSVNQSISQSINHVFYFLALSLVFCSYDEWLTIRWAAFKQCGKLAHQINQSINQSVNQTNKQPSKSHTECIRSALAFICLIDYLHTMFHKADSESPSLNQSISQSISQSTNQSTSQTFNQSLVDSRWLMLSRSAPQFAHQLQTDLYSKLKLIIPSNQSINLNQSLNQSTNVDDVTVIHIDAIITLIDLVEDVKKEFGSTNNMIQAFCENIKKH